MDAGATPADFVLELRRPQAIAEAERTGDFTGPKYLAANDRYMERYCWDDPDENSPEPLRRPTNGQRASRIAEGPNEFTENGTISDFEVTDELHKIHVPVLVTNGTDDLCTPLLPSRCTITFLALSGTCLRTAATSHC